MILYGLAIHIPQGQKTFLTINEKKVKLQQGSITSLEKFKILCSFIVLNDIHATLRHPNTLYSTKELFVSM